MTRNEPVSLISATADARQTELAHIERRIDMTLEASIRAGDLAAAIDLLRSGADANGRSPEGLTPLMIASGLGQPQMVAILLTAGADGLAVEPRMGAMAVHKASQSGNADVIGLLLDHGSCIDQQSPVLGNTPLMDAVSYKHEEAVRLLLKNAAPGRRSGTTGSRRRSNSRNTTAFMRSRA